IQRYTGGVTVERSPSRRRIVDQQRLTARDMMRRRTAVGIAIASAIGAVALGGAAWLAWPLPADALTRDARQSLTIEDRNGLPLRAARAADGSQTAWVPYEQIDPDLINAF